MGGNSVSVAGGSGVSVGGASVFVGGGSGVSVAGSSVSVGGGRVAVGSGVLVCEGRGMSVGMVRGRRVFVAWRGVGDGRRVAVFEDRGVRKTVWVAVTVGVETNAVTAC